MDLNLIKKLIKIVEQSEISDLSVEEGELKVSISKGSNNPNIIYQNTPLAAAPVQNENSAESLQAGNAGVNENYHEIKSPIVGTFYKASSPDAEPFVKAGDHIKSGTVLCIVEAMKLMNEIESDVDGKIVKILVENASPVEYNQPLFLVEKE